MLSARGVVGVIQDWRSQFLHLFNVKSINEEGLHDDRFHFLSQFPRLRFRRTSQLSSSPSRAALT